MQSCFHHHFAVSLSKLSAHAIWLLIYHRNGATFAYQPCKSNSILADDSVFFSFPDRLPLQSMVTRWLAVWLATLQVHAVFVQGSPPARDKPQHWRTAAAIDSAPALDEFDWHFPEFDDSLFAHTTRAPNTQRQHPPRSTPPAQSPVQAYHAALGSVAPPTRSFAILGRWLARQTVVVKEAFAALGFTEDLAYDGNHEDVTRSLPVALWGTGNSLDHWQYAELKPWGQKFNHFPCTSEVSSSSASRQLTFWTVSNCSSAAKMHCTPICSMRAKRWGQTLVRIRVCVPSNSHRSFLAGCRLGFLSALVLAAI